MLFGVIGREGLLRLSSMGEGVPQRAGHFSPGVVLEGGVRGPEFVKSGLMFDLAARQTI